MPTAHQIYDANVRDLAPSEKLRLASIILEDLAENAAPALDYSDAWTAEDIDDVAACAKRYAAEQFPEP